MIKLQDFENRTLSFKEIKYGNNVSDTTVTWNISNFTVYQTDELCATIHSSYFTKMDTTYLMIKLSQIIIHEVVWVVTAMPVWWSLDG